LFRKAKLYLVFPSASFSLKRFYILNEKKLGKVDTKDDYDDASFAIAINLYIYI